MTTTIQLFTLLISFGGFLLLLINTILKIVEVMETNKKK